MSAFPAVSVGGKLKAYRVGASEEPQRQPQHHPHIHASEIDALVLQRTTCRTRGQWDQANAITQALLKAHYKVRVIDYAAGRNKASEWRLLTPPPTHRLTWTSLMVTPLGQPSTNPSCCRQQQQHEQQQRHIPLIVATVDSPSYRDRYQETIEALRDWQSGRNFQFDPDPCYLLNLQAAATAAETAAATAAATSISITTKSVLLLGWRHVLLPYLYEKYANSQHDFILVAEDDIRFPSHATPQSLHTICQSVFEAHPDLQVLSLGHSWNALRKFQRRQQQKGDNTMSYQPSLLLDSLQSQSANNNASSNNGILHHTTLLAIRLHSHLHIATALKDAKPTHWDSYLFHSLQHDMSLAVCDPPLVGWAAVATTLTRAAAGQRRQDSGGRLGWLPPRPAPPAGNAGDETMPVGWIRRSLVENNNISSNNKDAG